MKTLRSHLVFLLVLAGYVAVPALYACSSPLAQQVQAVCPVPKTLPAAVTLARSLVGLVESVCGLDCPPELASVSLAINRSKAGRDEVCKAIPVVRLVTCSACSDRLEALETLVDCETKTP
jgi:hypothetical protein